MAYHKTGRLIYIYIAVFTILLGLFLFFGNKPSLARYPCEDSTECACGYCCQLYQGIGECHSCTTHSCPAPTQYQPPTPVPVAGGAEPTAAVEPTPGSGAQGVSPTPNPACNYSEPSSVRYGECSGAGDCPSSSSSVSCVSGSCVYSGNLSPCPDASCPTYWVPSGWGCSKGGDTIDAPSILINPNSRTNNDKYDVQLGTKVHIHHTPTTSDYGDCEWRAAISIGPDANHLAPALDQHSPIGVCDYIWTSSGRPSCFSYNDGNNSGAKNNSGSTYTGGKICAKAHLFWQLNKDGNWVGCPNGHADADYSDTICYTPPPCNVNSLSVSANNSCGSSTYSLSWSASYPDEADSFRIRSHNGQSWTTPVYPTNTSASYTSSSFPTGGYNFETCCYRDGSAYGCQQAGDGTDACPAPTLAKDRLVRDGKFGHFRNLWWRATHEKLERMA